MAEFKIFEHSGLFVIAHEDGRPVEDEIGAYAFYTREAAIQAISRKGEIESC